MSIIEQAAKRLAQLRQSGVEIDTGTSEHGTDAEARASGKDALPLRVARALEGQAPAAGAPGLPEPGSLVETHGSRAASSVAAVRSGLATGDAEPVVLPRSTTRVDIDLARLSAEGYITPQVPRSRIAEQFRVVKRPLLTNARGKSAAPVLNANRIMVTSSLPAEGKTFVAVNLAMSLVMEVDTHVLLVDADTSRPAVLDRLGLTASKGLLDLLIDPALPLESVVLSTNVERLSILPAGNPHGHATELLASEAMSKLVARLSAADPRLIVLFDTPPLLAASEARVLAAHMGQVILVAAADETPQATVMEALSTIENCPVVMTLLNRSTSMESRQYYGYYGDSAQ